MEKLFDGKTIGDACVFVDSHGKDRPALITAIHGDKCVNVAFVNDDSKQVDTYGLKIERASSVVHETIQQAHGYKWR